MNVLDLVNAMRAVRVCEDYVLYGDGVIISVFTWEVSAVCRLIIQGVRINDKGATLLF